jgi:hypothetical protein
MPLVYGQGHLNFIARFVGVFHGVCLFSGFLHNMRFSIVLLPNLPSIHT